MLRSSVHVRVRVRVGVWVCVCVNHLNQGSAWFYQAGCTQGQRVAQGHPTALMVGSASARQRLDPSATMAFSRVWVGGWGGGIGESTS